MPLASGTGIGHSGVGIGDACLCEYRSLEGSNGRGAGLMTQSEFAIFSPELSYFLRDLGQGLGQMAGFLASGEICHFPVTAWAVSPVPRGQFCAPVRKPGPLHGCVKRQPLNIAFSPHCISQSCRSRYLPAYVFALYFWQLKYDYCFNRIYIFLLEVLICSGGEGGTQRRNSRGRSR